MIGSDASKRILVLACPARRPDIAVARERPGWQPTTALDDGLRNAIDYFDEHLPRAGAAR